MHVKAVKPEIKNRKGKQGTITQKCQHNKVPFITLKASNGATYTV